MFPSLILNLLKGNPESVVSYTYPLILNLLKDGYPASKLNRYRGYIAGRPPIIYNSGQHKPPQPKGGPE